MTRPLAFVQTRRAPSGRASRRVAGALAGAQGGAAFRPDAPDRKPDRGDAAMSHAFRVAMASLARLRDGYLRRRRAGAAVRARLLGGARRCPARAGGAAAEPRRLV